MLDGNNGGYANDWLLADNKTGEIALFELGLKEHSVRRTKDGYFAGANFPVDPKLTKLETNFDVNNKQCSPKRTPDPLGTVDGQAQGSHRHSGREEHGSGQIRCDRA